MEVLVSERENVRLCKIDIVDWRSDVAQQHRIQSLPTLLLYDGTELVAEGTSEVLRRIQGL